MTDLSKQSSITLGLVILILGATITGTFGFARWLGKLDAWMVSTNERLTSIEQTLEDGIADRWRGVDMIRWVDRLDQRNPELDVPPPFTRGDDGD